MGGFPSDALRVDPKSKMCGDAVGFDALPARVPHTWHVTKDSNKGNVDEKKGADAAKNGADNDGRLATHLTQIPSGADTGRFSSSFSGGSPGADVAGFSFSECNPI